MSRYCGTVSAGLTYEPSQGSASPRARREATPTSAPTRRSPTRLACRRRRLPRGPRVHRRRRRVASPTRRRRSSIPSRRADAVERASPSSPRSPERVSTWRHPRARGERVRGHPRRRLNRGEQVPFLLSEGDHCAGRRGRARVDMPRKGQHRGRQDWLDYSDDDEDDAPGPSSAGRRGGGGASEGSSKHGDVACTASTARTTSRLHADVDRGALQGSPRARAFAIADGTGRGGVVVGARGTVDDANDPRIVPLDHLQMPAALVDMFGTSVPVEALQDAYVQCGRSLSRTVDALLALTLDDHDKPAPRPARIPHRRRPLGHPPARGSAPHPRPPRPQRRGEGGVDVQGLRRDRPRVALKRAGSAPSPDLSVAGLASLRGRTR